MTVFFKNWPENSKEAVITWQNVCSYVRRHCFEQVCIEFEIWSTKLRGIVSVKVYVSILGAIVSNGRTLNLKPGLQNYEGSSRESQKILLF
jgi:hypothetical protein